MHANLRGYTHDGKQIHCDDVLLSFHQNSGLPNSFQRILVPVYYWKTVEKPETDPQLL